MKRLAALALIGAALTIRAAETKMVDIDAIVAAAGAGLSETNGWTMSPKLSAYADSSLQFNEWGDAIVSPDYGAPVLRIEAKVRCSSTAPTRWLRVFAADSTVVLGGFDACKREGRLEDQTVVFGDGAMVSRFRLMLDETGTGSTGWGIGALSVITADPVAAPTGLRMTRDSDDWCVLAWENGENTVSNRVDAFVVKRRVDGETVLFSTEFDGFEAGGNPKDMTSALSEIDTALSGVRIYAAAHTNGICQLGTGRELGILRYDGCADYSAVSLRLRAKRYPGDGTATMVAYEAEGATNVVETLSLPDDEYEERVVDLSRVPSGAAILLGYYTTKSNRRVLIDSLSFVRAGAATETPAGSCWIAAAPGTVTFSTKGVFDFPPRAECRVAVCAVNADGVVSDAASFEARLGGSPGARLIIW